ncbi:MAG: response regulator [Pseudomonadota bacterium]
MKKILIIDDSSSIRLLLQEILETEGFFVTAAIDGKQGLSLVKKQEFDLIISDVNMPLMDGIEFTKEVRKLNEHQFTPILILTTEHDFDKKMEGKHAGATGWIVKPIVAEQLINTISRVL